MSRSTRKTWAFALLVAVLGATPLPAAPQASGEDGTAIVIPSTWQPPPLPTPMDFAQWKSGTATYRALTNTSFSGTTADLANIVNSSSAELPGQFEKTSESLSRCQTSFNLQTIKRHEIDGTLTVTEKLDYVFGSRWYTLWYNHRGSAADPNIEQIFRERCAADIPFTPPPAGWTALDRGGLSTTWTPLSVPPGVLQRLELFGDAYSGSLADSGPITIAVEHTRQTQSCGVPLLLVDGTIGGSTRLRADVAISLYGGRRYVAEYTFTMGSEDQATRAALETLCAKAPFPLPHIIMARAGPTPAPLADLPVRIPRSFHAKRVIVYHEPATAYTETVDQIVGLDGSTTTETRFDVPRPEVREAAWTRIDGAQYSLVGSTWYKHQISIQLAHGYYPAYLRGTIKRLADEQIDGAPLDVYEIVNGTNRSRVWVGKSDRYIHRYESHFTPVAGTTGDERMDLFAFDQPAVISPPVHFVDESTCPTPFIIDPQVKGSVSPAYPPSGPHLKQTVAVILAVSVAEDGSVTNIAIAKSSGYPVLDEAALTATRAASFSPATAYCAPFAGSAKYQVLFSPGDS